MPLRVTVVQILRELLQADFTTGVQALNEFTNVCRKKYGWDWTRCRADVDAIVRLASTVHATTLESQKLSLSFGERYNIAVFDALMLAIARRAGCTTFYSEDMHNGLVIDGVMTVVNPFA